MTDAEYKQGAKDFSSRLYGDAERALGTMGIYACKTDFELVCADSLKSVRDELGIEDPTDYVRGALEAAGVTLHVMDASLIDQSLHAEGSI